MEIVALVLSVLVSVVAAAIYGILFSRHEDRIRKYLATQRQGWQRRRYVRIFVQAVRAESRIDLLRQMSYLMLVFPIAAVGFTQWLHVRASMTADRIDHSIARVDASVKDSMDDE